jgi:hypothetical protein
MLGFWERNNNSNTLLYPNDSNRSTVQLSFKNEISSEFGEGMLVLHAACTPMMMQLMGFSEPMSS